MGTDYGLYQWLAAPATGTAPPVQVAQRSLLLPTGSNPLSLQAERIHQIFEDRNQVLWLAAPAGGLHKLDLRQKPFGHLQHELTSQPKLPNHYVNAIYKEEATGLLWIGTRNGLLAYDLRSKICRNYLVGQRPGEAAATGATGVDVSAVKQTADGVLWVGTRNHGVYTLRRVGGRPVLGVGCPPWRRSPTSLRPAWNAWPPTATAPFGWRPSTRA